MSVSHAILLKKYLQLPDRLEAALAGLSESDLDLRGEGWSIRQYVHHTVEGESMWQLFLRAIIGTNGIEFPIHWYFALTQAEWADRWASDRRAIQPSLALFWASTNSLVELLCCVDPHTWKHYGCVTWPGAKDATHFTVRDIVLMHIGHMDQHEADIRTILQNNQELHAL